MTKRSMLIALCLFGCASRVSLGQHGSETDPLTVEEPPANGGDSLASTPPDASAPDAEVIPPSEIDFVEVDETTSTVPRFILVDSTCHVIDHTGLDANGDPDKCAGLFAAAVDPTPLSCVPGCVGSAADCAGTLRVHLKDGRDLVRDLAAPDRCYTALPGVTAHKQAYVVWYSAGGK